MSAVDENAARPSGRSRPRARTEETNPHTGPLPEEAGTSAHPNSVAGKTSRVPSVFSPRSCYHVPLTTHRGPCDRFLANRDHPPLVHNCLVIGADSLVFPRISRGGMHLLAISISIIRLKNGPKSRKTSILGHFGHFDQEPPLLCESSDAFLEQETTTVVYHFPRKSEPPHVAEMRQPKEWKALFFRRIRSRQRTKRTLRCRAGVPLPRKAGGTPAPRPSSDQLIVLRLLDECTR